MSLTFKRNTLNNIDYALSEDTLYFCTDTNRIFFDYRDTNGDLKRIAMGGEYNNTVTSNDLFHNYLHQDDIGSSDLTNKLLVNYQYLNTKIGSADLTNFSDGTLSNACNVLEAYGVGGRSELIWSNPSPNNEFDTITINLTHTYQRYIMVFKKAVGTMASYDNDGDNCCVSVIFTLPQSIANNVYKIIYASNKYSENSGYTHFNRKVTLNSTNKTINISSAKRYHIETTYPEIIIPLEIYGWGA